MTTNNTNYFAAAKKAARKMIQDTSAAHSAAMKTIREIVSGKTDEFYSNMGWQAVLAAREGLVFKAIR